MVAYHPSHHSMVGQHPRLLLSLYPAPCPPPWARGVGLAQAGALQVGTMTRGREFKTITKAADQRLLFISTLPGKPTLGQGWSALPTGRRGSVMPHMATAAARAQHAHPHTFHPRASSVAGAWGWATASPAVTHSPQTGSQCRPQWAKPEMLFLVPTVCLSIHHGGPHLTPKTEQQPKHEGQFCL